jgi:O-antigen/teichoic acid export membrane protein
MLKAFFRDSAVYGTAKLLTGGVAVLSLPIYTHALNPGAYGVVDFVTTAANVAHVTVAMEIAQGLGRHVMSPDATASRERYASTALWFTVAAYLAFVAALMPFAHSISGLVFGDAGQATVVRVALLVTWSTGLFFFVQNLLRYQLRAVRYAIVSIVFTTVSVGTTAWLLMVVRTGAVGVFIGQLVGGVVASGLGLWFARDTIHWVFDRERCREMLAFSMPLVPSGLGVMLSLYVDRFAIIRLLSVADLGVYGVAFRISSIVAIAVASFQSSVAPLIYRHFDKPETPQQIARMLQWFLALALPLVLFVGIFSGELVGLAAPPSYAAAASLVFILSTSLLVGSLYNFSPGLWIAKRTSAVALVSIGSGVLNLLLNFVLIPRVGLVGAAVATAMSATIGCVLHFVLGQRCYRVPFRWSSIASASGIAIAGAVTAATALARLSLEMAVVAKATMFVALTTVIVTVLVGRQELRLVRRRVIALARGDSADHFVPEL